LSQILITRAEPAATETSERVKAIGHLPLVTPIFQTFTGSIDVSRPDRVAAILFTSRNAIEGVSASLRTRRVFAVGDATAQAAMAAGFDQVKSAAGNAQNLATLIADELDPAQGTLLLPTAKRQGIHLATLLRKRGFRVVRKIAYKVEKLPELPPLTVQGLRSGQVAVALFFSTESAHHFVRLIRAAGLVDTLRNVEAVAISQRAIMPLSPLPWRRVSVAEAPNQDAMLILLK
jgi:uroporphyrinogen-III synthase